MSKRTEIKEGGLDAPTRYPVKWKEPEFTDEKEFLKEAERVFDVCHGCRRCVSLCESFPTLFDLIDESETFEVDGVEKNDFQKVVDECYMCDLCYQTKCPYVPPHEWAIDFPHLMLRGKAIAHKKKKKGLLNRLRDKALTSTDQTSRILKIPLIDITYKKLSKSKLLRKATSSITGIHELAPLPEFADSREYITNTEIPPEKVDSTRGKVAIFEGCYCRNYKPSLVQDLIQVLEHNEILVKVIVEEKCCGMPKLDLGDLKSVEKLMEFNVPKLMEEINSGFDIISLVPSCVLMFKQELPLLFDGNEDLQTIKKYMYDPFEYLAKRDSDGKLKKDFKSSLGKIAYQVACHQRVQNIGPKTKELLEMIPSTEVNTIERCSGHDGTYAVKKETYENSIKIAKPVARKADESSANYLTSDCPLAASQIEHVASNDFSSAHPISLLKKAYNLK